MVEVLANHVLSHSLLWLILNSNYTLITVVKHDNLYNKVI